MNIQAMMKQAQSLQKDIEKVKNEINNKEFIAKSALVEVQGKGDKNITKISIEKDNVLEKEDIEMLEDMLLVALNDFNNQIDSETERKMSKFGNIPGLF